MSGADTFSVGFGDSSRNSSRVLNPPGGISSDIFGTNSLAHGPRSRNVSHLQSSFSFGDAEQMSGDGTRRRNTNTEGSTVYDVFPEKSNKRSPPTAGRLTRSEVMTERERETTVKSDFPQSAATRGETNIMTDDPTDEPADELIDQNVELLDQQTQQLNMRPQSALDRETTVDAHSTGHTQLPRVGSRNPITGFGIGEDDTREISSVGCDSHNDNSGSGRTTGKRMFNSYNKRSQQW